MLSIVKIVDILNAYYWYKDPSSFPEALLHGLVSKVVAEDEVEEEVWIPQTAPPIPPPQQADMHLIPVKTNPTLSPWDIYFFVFDWYFLEAEYKDNNGLLLLNCYYFGDVSVISICEISKVIKIQKLQ